MNKEKVLKYPSGDIIMLEDKVIDLQERFSGQTVTVDSIDVLKREVKVIANLPSLLTITYRGGLKICSDSTGIISLDSLKLVGRGAGPSPLFTEEEDIEFKDTRKAEDLLCPLINALCITKECAAFSLKFNSCMSPSITGVSYVSNNAGAFKIEEG